MSWLSPHTYSTPGLVLTLIVAAYATVLLFFWALTLLRTTRHNYHDRHVLITGGYQGLGLELAKRWIKAGANVTLMARTQAKLEAAQEKLDAIAADGQKVFVFAGDVTDPEACVAAVEAAEAELGPIYSVVANAGMSIPGYAHELHADEYDRTMRVNYLGTVNIVKACLPGLLERKEGQVVCVASMAAVASLVGFTAYSPTKAAVRSFAEALRQEIFPFGIDVSVCYPDDFESESYAHEMEIKPPECVDISATTDVVSPQAVALAMFPSIAKGHFHCRQDFFGGLLVTAMTGLSPRTYPLLFDIATAPLAMIVGTFVQWQFDGIVLKHYNARGGKPGVGPKKKSD